MSIELRIFLKDQFRLQSHPIGAEADTGSMQADCKDENDFDEKLST